MRGGDEAESKPVVVRIEEESCMSDKMEVYLSELGR